MFINHLSSKNHKLMKRFTLLTLFAFSVLFFASCGGNPEGSEAEVTDAAATTEVAGASNYTVDTASSLLTWKGSKITGSGHEGTLKLSEGTLKVEGGNLVGGNFTINMNSLDNTDLKGTEGHAKLLGHLKSDDFFSVATNPTATFEITGATGKTGDTTATHDISGNLTIKGITKNLTFPAKVTLADDKVEATAEFFFDRTLYDIKFNSASFFEKLGDNAINNEIGIKLSLKASKAAL
jgi:polyisoprenoid-binding protein YceI